jgi:hypothetical protein
LFNETVSIYVHFFNLLFRAYVPLFLSISGERPLFLWWLCGNSEKNEAQSLIKGIKRNLLVDSWENSAEISTMPFTKQKNTTGW